MFNREAAYVLFLLVLCVLATSLATAVALTPPLDVCVQPEVGRRVVVVSGTWAGGHGYYYQPGWKQDGTPVNIVRFDRDVHGGGLGAVTNCQLRIVQ